MPTDLHEEEFKLSGDDLVKKVKQIVREGKAREIIIRNEQGQDIIHLPLTVGVVGSLLAPPLAAVGAIAALVAKCTLVVVKKD